MSKYGGIPVAGFAAQQEEPIFSKAKSLSSSNSSSDLSETDLSRKSSRNRRKKSKKQTKRDSSNGKLGATRAEELSAKVGSTKKKRNNWEVFTHTDGTPYYCNVATGATVWEKPEELMTEGDKEEMKGEFLWVADSTRCWIPCRLLNRLSGGALEVVEVGKSKTSKFTITKKKMIGPSIESMTLLHQLTPDLVQLKTVDEPSILHLLRERFHRDKFYTSVGDILIAVNPFKSTVHFTPQEIHMYARSSGSQDMPPHPYAIIGDAYRQLCEYEVNQSILISGESGAGKTVTVKVCLEYLSDVAGSDTNVEQKVLAANPILEAFGNAKTLRNDNSSRFGKFMKVLLEKRFKRISGCHTINYLLEKSRIHHQTLGERNFHVFYYLLKYLSPNQQSSLQIESSRIEDYKYLQGGGTVPSDVDQEEFDKMNHAFDVLRFSQQDRHNLYSVTVAVLFLGNIDFEWHGDTGSKVSHKSAKILKKVASLLGCPAEVLERGLTMSESKIVTRPYNPSSACDARNSLAKSIYGRMFQWIVEKLNEEMKIPTEMNDQPNFIGLLDIFGFEIFKQNGFEQLCINFANEKLQQMFNRHTFTLEEETYKREGITDFVHVEFYDSQPLLDMLGLPEKGLVKRDGIFQLLDEQTALGNGTDEAFLSVISRKYRSLNTLFSDRVKSRSAFQIFHYAGAVDYEVGGFLIKNADKLVENLLSALSASTHSFVSDVLFATSSPSSSPSSGIVEKKKNRHAVKTQSGNFLKQLNALEICVLSTFPRFIRCIKPNHVKKSDMFVSDMCMEQLRFSGVLEAVTIRKKGFPFRYSHENFFKLYRCTAPKAVSPSEWKGRNVDSSQFKLLATKLLKEMVKIVPESANCRIGETMILYKTQTHRMIELRRLYVLNQATVKVQARARGQHIRSLVGALYNARNILRIAIQSRHKDRLQQALNQTQSQIWFPIFEQAQAEAIIQYLIEESRLLLELERLLAEKEPSKNLQKYKQAVDMMRNWQKKDPLAFKNETCKAIEAAYLKAATNKAGRSIMKATKRVDRAALIKGIAMAEEIHMGKHSDERIREVYDNAVRFLPQIEQVIQMLEEATKAVNEKKLKKALRAADKIGHGHQGTAGEQEVKDATFLYGCIKNLTRMARRALEVLEKAPMKHVVKGCKEIKLQLPELDDLESILRLKKNQFIKKQIQAALKLKNYRRAVRLSKEEKTVLLERTSDDLRLEAFCRMKTPQEFASSFIHIFKGRKKYHANMLQWYLPTTGKIHASLTQFMNENDAPSSLEDAQRLEATAICLFKNILGYMGDKKAQNANGFGAELLRQGLHNSIMRDEIFCQLMKQLTENPNPASLEYGWNLMALCLGSFPPSDDLLNHIEYFLISHNQEECRTKLHQTLIGGELVSPLNPNEVGRFRSLRTTDFFLCHKRKHVSFQEEDWTGSEQVDMVVESFYPS